MSAVLTEPYHFELIDGREVEKPSPKKLLLCLHFANNLPKFLRVAPELNVLCGEDRLVPDVTVMQRLARYLDGDLAEPPALAVEILSPGQTVGDLFGKADRLLRAGTPTRIIWPENRKCWTYTNSDLVAQVLEAALPDDNTLSVSLREMRAELD